MEKRTEIEQDYSLFIASPGRINLIGEHTDYNNGFVLPTAIDKKIAFKFRPNGTKSSCRVLSLNYNTELLFDLNDVKISDAQWENYILGVVYEIQQLSDGLRGFDCEFESDIPIGSGISSSAALECGMAFGLNELFNLNLSKQTIVELSQRAEHNFVGTKCGIMDQFASVMSEKGKVILLDCESLQYEFVPIQIKPYRILLLNTNVSHNLASGEYNTRRSQCESGVNSIKNVYDHVNSLRDVTLEMLEEFKNSMSEVVYNRCLYVVNEKQRVLNAVDALKQGKLAELGKLMYQTHDGLQHRYEVSCPELDFLVDFSKQFDEVLGARMMGGGFGGCTINIVHEDFIESFSKQISEAYFQEFNIKLTTFEANPSEGTAFYKK